VSCLLIKCCKYFVLCLLYITDTTPWQAICSFSTNVFPNLFSTPRMYMLSPSKSIKGSNYGEFLKDKYVLLMYTAVLSLTAHKYAPNLESLLTQQYVCVMCTPWSDNTCVFTRFYSVKNANTQLIWSSDCWPFFPISFCHCIVCPSSIYSLWLPIWDFQTRIIIALYWQFFYNQK
jgi:hypothetical protein